MKNLGIVIMPDRSVGRTRVPFDSQIAPVLWDSLRPTTWVTLPPTHHNEAFERTSGIQNAERVESCLQVVLSSQGIKDLEERNPGDVSAMRIGGRCVKSVLPCCRQGKPGAVAVDGGDVKT